MFNCPLNYCNLTYGKVAWELASGIVARDTAGGPGGAI